MGLVNKNVWIDEPEDDGITYFKFLRRIRRKTKIKIKRIFEIGYGLISSYSLYNTLLAESAKHYD